MKTVKSESPLDLSCDVYMSVLVGDIMLSQVKAVEQELQIESSAKINETYTNEELKMAGEMFLYLTMCPESIKPWLVFYKDLFQTQSPDQIILTLNRIMKGSVTATPNNEYFKQSVEMLLKRILSILPGRKTDNTESNIARRKPQKLEGT